MIQFLTYCQKRRRIHRKHQQYIQKYVIVTFQNTVGHVAIYKNEAFKYQTHYIRREPSSDIVYFEFKIY